MTSLHAHYAEVRARLWNPPNAVPDTGIDLSRKPIGTREIDVKTNDRDWLIIVSRPTIERVKEIVTRHFELRPFDLVSDCQQRHVARARLIAMMVCRRTVSCSIATIARAFRRDPSTISQNLWRVERRMKANPDFRKEVEKVVALVERGQR